MHPAGETLENQHVPIWELQVSIQQPRAAARPVAGCISTGSRTATQVPIQQPIGGDVSWVNHMRSMSREPNPQNGTWGTPKRHPDHPATAPPAAPGHTNGSAAKTACTWARIGSLLHPGQDLERQERNHRLKGKLLPRPTGTRQSRVAALTLTRSPASAYRAPGSRDANGQHRKWRTEERAVPNVRHGPTSSNQTPWGYPSPGASYVRTHGTFGGRSQRTAR